MGHLHTLLCREHSTLLSHIAQAWLCGCAGTGVAGLRWSPTCMGTHCFLVSMDMGKATLPYPGMLGPGSSAVCELLLPALSEQQGIAGQMPGFSKILETILCCYWLVLGLRHTAQSGWPAGGWQTRGSTNAGHLAKSGFPCLGSVAARNL